MRTSAFPLSGGFAGGTLIHTKKGLVCIEEITVGDWVLSKHSSGDGEQAYMQVINTFTAENIDIGLLRYFSESQLEQLLVTGTHPFYIDEVGWRNAVNACHPLKLVAHEGTPVGSWEWCSLWGTTTAGVAIGFSKQTDCGTVIDFRNGQAKVISELGTEGISNYSTWEETVHNLEVDNFHTYYVGELGVWVGDANCYFQEDREGSR